ncbi:MAG: DNA repair protein RecO [Sulfobacillus sp.]
MREDRQQTLTALVLALRPQGEADCRVESVTAELGRVGAWAKGLRRPKAKLGGVLQPFTLVALTVHNGKSRVIIGAEMVSGFRTLKEDYNRLTAAALLAELLLAVVPADEPAPAVLALSVRALTAMEQAQEPLGPLLVVLRDLMQLLGWGVNAEICAVCAQPLTGTCFLQLQSGVITHGHCRRSGMALDAAALASLAGPTAQPSLLALEALAQLWQTHLERPLKSLPAVRSAFHHLA